MAKKTSANKVTIKITNAELVNEFYPAITTMGTLPITNIDVLITVAKARKSAKELYKEFFEVRKQLAEADCKKDKAGKPDFKVNDEGQKDYQYGNEAVEQKTEDLIVELSEKEIEFEVKPFKAHTLKNVKGLNGNTLEQLGDLIVYE
jgi:hypothetical protein